ncbi:hypothetical protein VNO77_37519 [Canavalia gladiata]|uniref:Protein kinase domain-containing protein n=1 Tax=Canavalia gladiata TaxID=3824 RepID=A0AAN9KC62_CANGL
MAQTTACFTPVSDNGVLRLKSFTVQCIKSSIRLSRVYYVILCAESFRYSDICCDHNMPITRLLYISRTCVNLQSIANDDDCCNLANDHGYTIPKENRLLVYEYMEWGNLEEKLFKAIDGLEKDQTHITTHVMGTHGYAVPEYISQVSVLP